VRDDIRQQNELDHTCERACKTEWEKYTRKARRVPRISSPADKRRCLFLNHPAV